MWNTASVQVAKPVMLGAMICFSSAQTQSIRSLDVSIQNSKYENYRFFRDDVAPDRCECYFSNSRRKHSSLRYTLPWG